MSSQDLIDAAHRGAHGASVVVAGDRSTSGTESSIEWRPAKSAPGYHPAHRGVTRGRDVEGIGTGRFKIGIQT